MFFSYQNAFSNCEILNENDANYVTKELRIQITDKDELKKLKSEFAELKDCQDYEAVKADQYEWVALNDKKLFTPIGTIFGRNDESEQNKVDQGILKTEKEAQALCFNSDLQDSRIVTGIFRMLDVFYLNYQVEALQKVNETITVKCLSR